MKYEDQRKIMIEEQIVERGITNETVINALGNVPREEFVPIEFRDFAYKDGPLRIGEDQTISQPYIVAQMTSLLDLTKEDKVLEIGTGSGYQTAILAELTEQVFTVERFDSLSKSAKQSLSNLGYSNIYYRIGDGTEGWKNAYPPIKQFDKIIITAAAPQIPKSLISQMGNNSKLIAPVGNRNSQELVLLSKIEGEIVEEKYDACSFVPLIGLEGWEN
ncbi:MAG: protein-L-isoaspartate(D-aspartate) O-methyltransferase [Candidatus Cloacimonadota bacterium]|nr:protein-L-isoaspartate(D-aspartate) O-methyltransferase [Candidatus Cloacimonadota bacterium]